MTAFLRASPDDKGPRSAQRLLRRYSLAMFINSAATGLWLSGGVIFLTRFMHLSAQTVGLGLSAGGMIGLISGVPIGAVGDRFGLRNVAVMSLLLQVPASLGFLLSHAPAMFFAAAVVQGIGLAGSSAARGGLLAGLFGATDAARARNTQRAVSNAAIAAGSGAGGLVLAADSSTAYVGLVVAMSVAYLLAATAFATLPEVRAPHRGSESQKQVISKPAPLRDSRYLAATALNGLLNVQYPVLTVAVPLWIISETSAPVWTFSILMLINTAICVSLQIPAGKLTTDTASSAVSQRRSTYLFILACALFATTVGLSPVWTIAFLIAAVIVHSLGEVLQASSSFTLSFTLASEGSQGQYQGIWGIGTYLGQRVAPVILTSMLAIGHAWAWAMIAALFLGAGLITKPVIRWASQAQPAQKRSEHPVTSNST